MEHRSYLGKLLLVLTAALFVVLTWSLSSALAQPADGLPPVAYAGPDQAVLPGTTVTLDGSGSYDPDSELPLSYLWAQIGSPAVTFTPTLSVTAFTAPAVPTVLTFTLSVTNSVGVPDPTPDEMVVRVMGQPTANDDSGPGFITDEDTSFVTADVLANDTDPIGSPLWVDSFDASATRGLVTYSGGGNEPPGSLDTAGFGAPNGYVITNIGSEEYSRAVAIQPDGKILQAGLSSNGTNYDLSLVRYNPDGSLDDSFGDGGKVTTGFTMDDAGSAIALQPDGKIIVAGDTTLPGVGYDWIMARYNPEGSLDASFGVDGRVITDLGYISDHAHAVAIQYDGKILVAGESDNNFALVRYNLDGSLDNTFGTDGIIITDLGGYDSCAGMAIQSDHKILLAGLTDFAGTNDFAVARYNLDGNLDPSFGDDGVVIIDLGYEDYGTGIALQSDNKAVVAGYLYHGVIDFGLIRLNSDGSLDAGFDSNGKVITDFGSDAYGLDVAIQPNGYIIEAGSIYSENTYFDFALARFQPNGSLDLTFGNNGRVTTDMMGDSNSGQAVVLQADGKIVLAGNFYDESDYSFSIARYNGDGNLFTYYPNGQFKSLTAGEEATDTFSYVVTNGLLTDTAVVSITVTGVNDPPIAKDDSGPAFTTDEDTAFITGNVLANDSDPESQPLSVGSFDASGTHGLVTFNGGGGALPGSLDTTGFGAPNGYITFDFGNLYSEGMAVAIQTDGKIVVAGRSCDYECIHQDFALSRFNPDGSLDTTFGLNGKVITNFGDTSEAYDLAIQADGKIVAAGYTWSGGGDFALARYNPDGSPDTGFGTDGKETTDFGHVEFIEAIAIQSDGRIVAAGFTDYGSNALDFALARYNPNGSLDASFGVGGKVITHFGKFNTAMDVAIQSDGKIVAAGSTYATDYSDHNFAMARYLSDGNLDDSFGNNGMVITDISYGNENYADAIAIQPDGKIVVAGTMVDLGDNRYFAFTRYNQDGTLDNTFGNGSGIVVTYFGSYVECNTLAIQPDSKIVAGGIIDNPSGSDFVLTRYNPDGNLDDTFGDWGKVITDLGSYETIRSIALQPDGKIVVVGYRILARYNNDISTFTYDPNGQFEYLTADETATDTFTYVVSDGVLTNTATVSITITGVNDPPSFTSTPITTAEVELPYTYTVTTDDPDVSDSLTITAPTLPTWLTLADHGDRTATLSGTPPAAGSYPVALQGTDGISSTLQAFTITVGGLSADLSITQAFQWTSATSGVFTLTVINPGPNAAPGTIVSDTFPAGFSGITWACTSSGGASCTSSGGSNLYDTLVFFPAGGGVTYVVTVAQIPARSWLNTAEVIAPSSVDDPVPANNRAGFGYEIKPVFLPMIGQP